MSEYEDRQLLGKKLREAREFLGFSQDDIAKYLGLHRPSVSLIESGDRKVDAFELKRMAGIYGYPVDYFLGNRDIISSEVVSDKLSCEISKLSPDDRGELENFVRYLAFRKAEKTSKQNK